MLNGVSGSDVVLGPVRGADTFSEAIAGGPLAPEAQEGIGQRGPDRKGLRPSKWFERYHRSPPFTVRVETSIGWTIGG